ncbi:MAG: carboxypeptidase-like regulatory domain-containing protein [Ilumatobacter sp.]|uniref:carboxypeptidase-like regulatory domain-containing protein n=1 Tax=Ilumatobacter sp. TaxID=1967498 RepID=UPI00260C2BF0|nr:carboxypeptidase-like regulatory domain-containing protein [Ilumatobacter sp.]MDJ0768458.1 carboxypeptidase-like regulatory domain-containing protein [Ilumatobacter sp.]
METMLTAYPDFVPNQILTSTQLNDLRSYLDQQHRLTRVRLVGTGIACGLDWNIADQELTLSAGFGVTSDGYLVDLTEMAFDRYRAYVDPDVQLDGLPGYQSWRTEGGQVDLIELVETEATGSGASLTDEFVADRADWVVVVYLEQTSVELDSCLVTDCDSEGRNFVLTPRVLLAEPGVSAELDACGGRTPPPVVDIARLHRALKLTAVSTVDQIDMAYTRLATGVAPELSDQVVAAFETYGSYLDLDSDLDPADVRESTKAFIAGARGAQYGYDLVKDLIVAYEEMTTAACELVGTCAPALDHPRHLLLGQLSGGGSHRHGWYPSPVRDVTEGARDKVRDLFHRIVAMARAADPDRTVETPPSIALRPPSIADALETGPSASLPAEIVTPSIADRVAAADTVADAFVADAAEMLPSEVTVPFDVESMREVVAETRSVRLVPSHTERWPLGHRAIPFYYEPTPDLVRLWHPSTCCTATAPWGTGASAASDIGEDYGRCSLVRVEGHVGLDRDAAVSDIHELRSIHHVEFDVIAVHADLDAPDDGDVDEAVTRLDEIADGWGELRQAASKAWSGTTTWTATMKVLLAGLEQLREAERGDAIEAWRAERCDRLILCDVGHLEADYLAARGELLCVLDTMNEISDLPGIGDMAELPTRDETVSERRLLDELRVDLAARRPTITALDELLVAERRVRDRSLAGTAVARPEWLSLVLSWTRLRSAAAGLVNELPKQLCSFNHRLFVRRFDHVTTELAVLELLAGQIDVDVEADPANKDLRRLLDRVGATMSRAVGATRHLRPTFDAVALLYEVLRSRGAAVLRTVAERAPGLEHVGGVETGGTFVLVCGADGEVGADFSLAGQLPCCCSIDVDDVCLPPVAGVVVAVGDVELGGSETGGNWMQPVDIDLGTHHRRPNDPTGTPAGVAVPEATELGGTLERLEGGVVRYRNETPIPGAVDRFSFTLDDDQCGTDEGHVLIYLRPPEEQEVDTGTILGEVTLNGEPFSLATARLSGRPDGAEVSDDGTFRFDDVEAGRVHTVTLEIDQWDGPAAQRQVEVSAGEETTVRFALEFSTVDVIVLNERSEPEPGVVVSLISRRTREPVQRTTDRSGRVRFASVAPGPYGLLAQGSSQRFEFELGFGETVEYEFQIQREQPTGSIRGLVTFDGKRLNLEEVGFAAVATLDGRTLPVSPDASFVFQDVEVGRQFTVRVVVEPLGQEREERVVVSSPSEPAVVQLDFELASIDVVVRLPDDVIDVRRLPEIELVTDDPLPANWPALTTRLPVDDRGRVRFTGLPPGDFRVRVVGDPTEREINVVPGRREEVVLDIEGPAPDEDDGPSPRRRPPRG